MIVFVMIPKNDSIGFGARLKGFRIKHQLTQEQLAKDIKASKSFVCLCENGKVKEISARLLLLMAKRLKVDPSWLLFGRIL